MKLPACFVCLALVLPALSDVALLETTVAIDGVVRPLRVLAGQTPADAATQFAVEHGLVGPQAPRDSLVVHQLTEAVRARLAAVGGDVPAAGPRISINVTTTDGRELRFEHDGDAGLERAIRAFCDGLTSAAAAHAACLAKLSGEAEGQPSRARGRCSRGAADPVVELEVPVRLGERELVLRVLPGVSANDAARRFVAEHGLIAEHEALLAREITARRLPAAAPQSGPTASRELAISVTLDGSPHTVHVQAGQTPASAARAFCLRTDVGIAAAGGPALDACVTRVAEIVRGQLSPAVAAPLSPPLFTVPVRLGSAFHEVPYHENEHPSHAAARFCAEHWPAIARELGDDDSQPAPFHEQECVALLEQTLLWMLGKASGGIEESTQPETPERT